MTTINVTTAAAKSLIAHAKKEASGGVYAKYVAENNIVTKEDIAEHVQALATAAYPGKVDPAVRKNFCNTIRNGLNRNVAKPEATPAETDYIARIVKAVEAANDANVSRDQIVAAVMAHVAPEV